MPDPRLSGSGALEVGVGLDGRPQRADPDLLPDHHEISLSDPQWEASVGFSMPLKARYELLNETSGPDKNTPPHVSHPESIGTDEVAEARVEFEELGRFMRDARYCGA